MSPVWSIYENLLLVGANLPGPILLPGIECAYQYRKGNVLIARIVDPLDSQLADGFLEEDGLGVAKILQLHFDCHYLLLVRHIQEEVQIIAFSDEKRVRAYEFLDYIISDFGLVKGNAHYAYGKVSYIYLGAKQIGRAHV